MVISTERVYYTDTYLDKLKVKVLEVGQDEVGSYVICDKTIFHPQGGGQLSDEGYLEKGDKHYKVKKLTIVGNPLEGIIYHYYKGEGEFLKGEEVFQVIDLPKRLLFARYHSAGHLLSLAVNQLYPELDGYKGNHFPPFPNPQAFVVFEGNLPADFTAFKEKVTSLVNELVKKNLAVLAEWKDNSRTIHFAGFAKNYPCGGTHVKNTAEIGEITIRNAKKVKGSLRIGYAL